MLVHIMVINLQLLDDAKYPRTGAQGSWYLGPWSRNNSNNATYLYNINTETPKYDGYETTYESNTTWANPSGGKVKADNENFDAFMLQHTILQV